MTFAKMFPSMLQEDMLDPDTYVHGGSAALAGEQAAREAQRALAEKLSGERLAGLAEDTLPHDNKVLLGDAYARERMQPKPILPKETPAAAPSSAPPPERVESTNKAGNGFDWERGLAGLFEGSRGIANIDSGRNAKARLALDQSREKRQGEADGYALEQQRQRAAMAKAAQDPASAVSNAMRSEMSQYLAIVGEALPGLKPQLEGMGARLGSMSAADMMQMQDKLSGVFNLVRGVQHDKAMQDIAKDKRDLTIEGIEATRNERALARLDRERDREERREDKQEALDEKDIAALGKETAPIDTNAKTLEEIKGSKVTTGWLPDKFHKVRQFVGIKDDDWDTAEGALASVRNEIRHGLFGGALSPGEKAEFEKELPDMSMPRATFDAKLAAALKKMAAKRKVAEATHPRAVKALGKTTVAPDAGQAAKIARAKEILADPNESPEKKAKAQKWLTVNAQ